MPGARAKVANEAALALERAIGPPWPSQGSGETVIDAELLTTGVRGLDEILGGGLARAYTYLVEGAPGSGKTTLGMQFLLEGAQRGERCALVSISESVRELRNSAASHGWSLDDLEVVEVRRADDLLDPESRYTMFHPSEVEFGETMERLRDELGRLAPTRVLIDSISELRLLAEAPLSYRRHLRALVQYCASRDITAIITDEGADGRHDLHLHSLVHGVIALRAETPTYGPFHRHLQVKKIRGRPFLEGEHDFTIEHGGLQVHPRLVAADYARRPSFELLPSGSDTLDQMLGRGLPRGTGTLLLGPSGSGKSSLTTLFVHAAAERGERVAGFLFDEAVPSYLARAEGLGLDLREAVESGQVELTPVDTAEMTPGLFARLVQQAVEERDARIVVIDSLSGYMHAMPDQRDLTLHLHELLAFLGRRDVATFMLLAQHGIFTDNAAIDASYLADTVILLRYFEAEGEVRQAISVIKKRIGGHERTLRELVLRDGIRIGEPLRNLRGILTGVPGTIGESAGNSAP